MPGLGACSLHLLDSGRIHGHRLFGEDMDPGVYAGLEMLRAKMGWCSVQYHINAAVEDPLVSIESDKASLLWHVDATRKIASVSL